MVRWLAAARRSVSALSNAGRSMSAGPQPSTMPCARHCAASRFNSVHVRSVSGRTTVTPCAAAQRRIAPNASTVGSPR